MQKPIPAMLAASAQMSASRANKRSNAHRDVVYWYSFSNPRGRVVTWGLSLQIVATAIPGHGKDRRTAAFISQQEGGVEYCSKYHFGLACGLTCAHSVERYSCLLVLIQ